MAVLAEYDALEANAAHALWEMPAESADPDTKSTI
jgi:hypothetical protein